MVRSSNMQNAEMDTDVGMVDVDEDKGVEPAVYEVGYHLLPTIAEDELGKAVQAVTEALKATGADFVGERFPAKLELAYPIVKRVNDKKTPFMNAYFGWIAFVLPKSSIANVKQFMDKNPNVLRYLIVRTSRDAVAAAMTGATVTPTGSIEKPKRDVEAGGELSEAALEEALQTMEKEDTKTAE